MTFTTSSECVYWYVGVCVSPLLHHIGMQPNGYHGNTSQADKSHLSPLVKRVCVLWMQGGGSCFSSVCNIDRPCNEFLVPPPPQFEWEAHWHTLSLPVCVCVCVHTDREWMTMEDKIKQTSDSTVHYWIRRGEGTPRVLLCFCAQRCAYCVCVFMSVSMRVWWYYVVLFFPFRLYWTADSEDADRKWGSEREEHDMKQRLK